MKRLQLWLSYRETVLQLESLGERELSDLGIGRRDIKRLARQATQAAETRTSRTLGLVPAGKS